MIGTRLPSGNISQLPFMLQNLLQRGCTPYLRVYLTGGFQLGVPNKDKLKLEMSKDHPHDKYFVADENQSGHVVWSFPDTGSQRLSKLTYCD